MDILGMLDLASWSEVALLLAAAFVAGALNAVAGGGSFLTLPALVFVGVPAVTANATGTVALLPGYAASAWGFKEDMAAPRTDHAQVHRTVTAGRRSWCSTAAADPR